MKMKRLALIMAISAAAVLTACSGNKTENVETQAQTQAAEDETKASSSTASREYTEAALPEEYDQEFYEGIVTDCSGSFITIDGENGEMSFDISANDDEDMDEGIVRGCYVEVIYADVPEGSTYPAESVSLLNDNEQLAQEKDEDPVIYGKLQHIDVNELTIVDDTGRTVDFDNVMSRTVSFADLKQGDEVIVSYAGSVYDEDDVDADDEAGVFNGVPVAIKVVALDAQNTEEAQADYIVGQVSTVAGDEMLLSTTLTDFNVSATEDMLKGIEEEQNVKVYYTGALSDIIITADKIEVVND